MIEREKKRIKLTKKYESKRQALLDEYNSTSDFNLKLEIHSKIQRLPRNSSKIRIRNRCWKTGRPRGFYRDFGVSRHVLREMAHQCLLPGTGDRSNQLSYTPTLVVLVGSKGLEPLTPSV